MFLPLLYGGFGGSPVWFVGLDVLLPRPPRQGTVNGSFHRREEWVLKPEDRMTGAPDPTRPSANSFLVLLPQAKVVFKNTLLCLLPGRIIQTMARRFSAFGARVWRREDFRVRECRGLAVDEGTSYTADFSMAEGHLRIQCLRIRWNCSSRRVRRRILLQRRLKTTDLLSGRFDGCSKNRIPRGLRHL